MNQVGISQKAVILNSDGKILAVKRGKTAPFHASLWDLPGGILDFGEDAYLSIKREIKEEVGIEVKDLELFDVETHVNGEDNFWVTLAYKTNIDQGDIKLSYEHSEHKWVTKDEYLKLDATEKTKKFIRHLFRHSELVSESNRS